MSIDPGPNAGPIPLSGMEVSYPIDLGLETSELGLQSCDPAALQLRGTEACPANSKMGQGEALVEVPFGPEVVHERVALGIYAAPSGDGYLHLAIIAYGAEPVLARVVLSAVLEPGRLMINIPPILTLPGVPYATLVDMHATLGGPLVYHERSHGRTIAYKPRGIGLPDTCPAGGWRFAARLTFSDGQLSRAGTVVKCPAGRTRTRRR